MMVAAMLAHKGTCNVSSSVLSARNSQRGLTLVELLIGMTLGVFMLGGLALVFSQTSSNLHQNEQVTYMQDQARFALQTLSRDLQMAGYWGGVYGYSNIATTSITSGVSITNECVATGTTFDLTNAIEFRNETSGTSINSTFGCLAAADYAAGTDAIFIRRTSGTTIAEIPTGVTEVTLSPSAIYMQSNQTVGELLQADSSQPETIDPTRQPNPAPMDFFKFIARLYFIQPYWQTAGDGIPSLCRYELDHAASPSMTKECLAQGVEDFQIVWGIVPTTGPKFIDSYLSAPTADELKGAKSARIYLLMRSVEEDASHTDSKSYSVGNKTAYTPGANDHHYRRLYSTTVSIKNPISQQ